MFRISFVLLLVFGCISSPRAQELQRIGHLPYAPLTLAGCWHHVDNSGGEWALVGTSAGLSIVDLSNPSQPVQRFSVLSLANNWREVRTWAGYAYFVSEAPESAVTIVNLNYLPDSIQWKVWRGDGFFTDKVVKSHALQATDGYLYLCGGSEITNGVVIADLANPWNPNIVSKYAANYVHDAYIRGDTLWTSEIYEGQFGVVDISNKTNPVLLATQPTPGAFNHNTGLSDDGKTIFTTDERADAPLASFDVSDLENIKPLDLYRPSRKPQGEVHNVRVMPGDFLVCPSYKGQLTIVDASKPDNMIETAWDSLGTSLVWDADPYLPSGIIIATAKIEGLFIYQKPSYKHAAWIQGTVTDAATGAPLADAKVFILNTPNADSTGASGQYKTGAPNTGSYALRAERNGYQSQVVTNVSLVSGSTTELDFLLSPLVDTQNIEETQFLSVSPSPFVDFLRVEFQGVGTYHTQSATLLLRNFCGQKMVEQQADPSGASILNGLNYLPAGLYLLEIRTENGLYKAIRVLKS